MPSLFTDLVPVSRFDCFYAAIPEQHTTPYLLKHSSPRSSQPILQTFINISIAITMRNLLPRLALALPLLTAITAARNPSFPPCVQKALNVLFDGCIGTTGTEQARCECLAVVGESYLDVGIIQKDCGCSDLGKTAQVAETLCKQVNIPYGLIVGNIKNQTHCGTGGVTGGGSDGSSGSGNVGGGSAGGSSVSGSSAATAGSSAAGSSTASTISSATSGGSTSMAASSMSSAAASASSASKAASSMAKGGATSTPAAANSSKGKGSTPAATSKPSSGASNSHIMAPFLEIVAGLIGAILAL